MSASVSGTGAGSAPPPSPGSGSGGAGAPPGTLADLPKGGRAVIAGIEGREPVVQRLLEMGLTKGTPVEVVRFAPLGDPLEVRVRGYLLSLRHEDARCVRVTRAS